ncbi:acetyl-CoA C-acetyltransferase [Gracilibacillus sp. YIM 98692]|uniref:acetyl-CoA C-acetyltransferase n=1 Tax=Gracilibacillus sp. YIM 98692 TaxID=2663532 RepID=UPI0013D3656F|nr:acetyl-CoA C-acetyltransferase [Gracilibacillus sp. YIM 98692]
MREVVVVGAVRTAIGKFGGSLSGLSAVELGSIVIKEVLQRAKLNPDNINEVIMGNVLSAGLGQNPARQSAVKAELPYHIPAYTVNKVCGSGLKSIHLAAQSIAAGDTDVVVAGGMECMSQSPYLLNKARNGYRMGNGEIVDSMVQDGLWDAFNDIHMGVTAENIAEKLKLNRTELDEFAATSQNKAEAAQAMGKFEAEVVDCSIPQRKGETITFKYDESIRRGTTSATLANLRPVFKKHGIVTAGNSSGISDGAAAVLLMSKEKAEELGLKPMVKIVSNASAGCDPKLMGLGPVPAVQKTLQKAGWETNDVDIFELNEAFAAQSLGVLRELGLSPDIVNVNGGAIALGHPIGASGTRIVVTLLHEMVRSEHKRGIAALCIGGGQGITTAFEKA